ncbi:SDR family oxidoreductase [Rubinisphaera sp.]|uniref:SDR family oxidoreductase n=1 Tax=Rubinisphaera sp. TaxID=2024857 RepID=UPI0025DA0DA1|nr:SDR family oxidoreductase [Rubinisphaera sp.]
MMINTANSDTNYLLMTGATGLLGRYLMKDLALANVPLAVVVRPSRRLSAESRIESIMDSWEDQLNRPLMRPVVLAGELCEDALGMEPNDIRWASENCTGMIHNAASLSFVSTGPEAEPYRSNVGGTKNVLQFCQEAGIREFHHVSTAYVCGLRNGTVLPSELDVGQEFGNPYEESKVMAEKMVRGSEFIDSLTVYRPGIIVGDSKNGFTNTFHGFYAAVQLIHTILRNQDLVGETGFSDVFRTRINLDGTESKNFVPVDWVSGVMAHILSHENLHGDTYHLTPRNAVKTRTINAALCAACRFFGSSLTGADTHFEEHTELEEFFYEHIRVYNSYWRNDPTFDSTNTQKAAPHLLCPHMDYEMLKFLADQAIKMNFTFREKPVMQKADRAVVNVQ